MARILIGIFLSMALGACRPQYTNTNPVNQAFPVINGNTLEEQPVTLPRQFQGQKALLLLVYKQNAQFDIDRWLIGLDMRQADVAIYEVPATQGFIPKLIGGQIDNGMRKGIPSELWSIVITVYDDGETLQAFTGNEKPNNARVVLLDEKGKVMHFYDRGFSVAALNELLIHL